METYAREQIQQFIQRLLEEEVEGRLGRGERERRRDTTLVAYRDGDGKPRQLALTIRSITVKRPRLRDLDARFVSRTLPLSRPAREVGALLPERYRTGCPRRPAGG